jgi:hypothetical protein
MQWSKMVIFTQRADNTFILPLDIFKMVYFSRSSVWDFHFSARMAQVYTPRIQTAVSMSCHERVPVLPSPFSKKEFTEKLFWNSSKFFSQTQWTFRLDSRVDKFRCFYLRRINFPSESRAFRLFKLSRSARSSFGTVFVCLHCAHCAKNRKKWTIESNVLF